VATAGPSSPLAAAAPVPELVWVDCGEGLQCATARVPLDHDDPDGPRISLALIRLPAGDPGRRIGSLILGAGGPGESAVDIVRASGRFLGTEELRARFDLVGLDPRGIDRSTPLRCFDTLAEARAAQAPFRFPVTAQEERSWVRADRRIARACARRGGPILDHMSTG
jgi:pimeloyl-ACP methyl ester carboxylesterase